MTKYMIGQMVKDDKLFGILFLEMTRNSLKGTMINMEVVFEEKHAAFDLKDRDGNKLLPFYVRTNNTNWKFKLASKEMIGPEIARLEAAGFTVFRDSYDYKLAIAELI